MYHRDNGWACFCLSFPAASVSQHPAPGDIFSYPPTKYFHSSQCCLLCLLVLQGLWAPSPNWLCEVSRNRGSYPANTNVLAPGIKTSLRGFLVVWTDCSIRISQPASPSPAPRNRFGSRIWAEGCQLLPLITPKLTPEVHRPSVCLLQWFSEWRDSHHFPSASPTLHPQPLRLPLLTYDLPGDRESLRKQLR